MLRKLLLFLSILLIVLILVWSLPQCSRQSGPIGPQAENTQTIIPSPAPPSAASTAAETQLKKAEPPAPVTNETAEQAITAEPPAPIAPSTTVAKPVAAGGETEGKAELDKTDNAVDNSTDAAASAEDQPAPPSSAPANDTASSEPDADNAASTEGATSVPKENGGESASHDTAPAMQQPSTTPAEATAEPPATTEAPATTIILDGVNFALNSDQLMEGSETVLDNVVASLTKSPGIRLEIAGYTDDRGDPLYNRILSRRRAEAVMIYLVKHGIDARRLTAAGYGSDDPIADNATEAGRQKNRRVELHIR